MCGVGVGVRGVGYPRGLAGEQVPHHVVQVVILVIGFSVDLKRQLTR